MKLPSLPDFPRNRGLGPHGFSLIEVMIAMGIASILALAMAQVIVNQGVQLRQQRIEASRDELKNRMANLIGDAEAILNTEDKLSNSIPVQRNFSQCIDGTGFGGCNGGSRGNCCNETPWGSVTAPFSIPFYDRNDVMVSGTVTSPVSYNQNGSICVSGSASCVFNVWTTYEVDCPGPGGSGWCASLAEDITIKFHIEQVASADPTEQKLLRPIVGTVTKAVPLAGTSLATTGGSGTENTVPKWDASGNLVVSSITEVANDVGISAANPQERLHIETTDVAKGIRVNTSATSGNQRFMHFVDRGGTVAEFFDANTGNLTGGMTLQVQRRDNMAGLRLSSRNVVANGAGLPANEATMQFFASTFTNSSFGTTSSPNTQHPAYKFHINYPSNPTPLMTLSAGGRLYFRGGSSDGTFVGLDALPGGMHGNDGAIFVPTYTGTESSDLRLYIPDNSNDQFSIWGDTCNSGACNNLDLAVLGHAFRADGQAYHRGRVGIGVSVPATALHVQNNVLVSGTDARVSLGGSDGSDPLTNLTWHIDNHAANNNAFRIFEQPNVNTSGIAHFFIERTTGNVGVGIPYPTTNTAGKVLHVHHPGTNGANIHLTNNTTGAGPADGVTIGKWNDGTYGNGIIFWNYEATPITIATSAVARIFIAAAGNVGIGTTTPGYRLQVGNAGDGSEARANAWNTLSDERLKRDFETIPDALDRLSGLSGYYYHWKQGQDQERKIGLKAQEVKKIFPEAVSEGSDGYLSVSYDHLIAPVIEAIKELHAMIQDLSETVQEVLAKLLGLDQRVGKLERAVASRDEKIEALEARNQALEARSQAVEAALCRNFPNDPVCVTR